MQDFQLRNDTRLLFRQEPGADLQLLLKNKKVLFVYGGGSVKRNGCYEDVKTAVESGGGTFYELGNVSRELSDIEKGISLVKEQGIEWIVGAGGASVMDTAKLIAFGVYHAENLWDYVKGKKNPYGEKKMPLILMPTYPSSGSEYGLGAVSVDSRTGDFGTAYGIAADYAVLVPKYSLSLNEQMTIYTGLVTFVQLSASTIGDRNPVSYDIGISVIRNVWKATKRLKEQPDDLDARGVILYGAALSTSSRLGLGKVENYPYDIYELEFIPEVLFGASYRKGLTTVFPRFLEKMGSYHEADIRAYLKDVFGYEGSVKDSVQKIIASFTELGVDMYFDGDVSEEQVRQIEVESSLNESEIFKMIQDCMR